MNDTVRDLLKSKAAARRDPEFQEAQTELAHKLQWATLMKELGRLTTAEYKEFEAHCTHEYLEALPVEAFVEMQKDGSYRDLEAIARSHDGKRHGTDVLKDRAELNKKVTRDGLDEALSRNTIDARRWNEEQRKIGTFDEETNMRVTDAGDDSEHDEIALDNLLSRLPDAEPPVAPVNEDRIKSADED